MKEYLEQFNKSMELRGFAKSTKENYIAHRERFTHYSGKHPAACGYDEVRNFLHHAIKVRKLSCSYVNSSYAALKFYFETTLCCDWNMRYIPRLKSRSFLPEVLTPEEVTLTLNALINLKHRALLSTIYSAGLRVSEATHLKIKDINSSNMRIFVRPGKGFKDRNTLLSKKNLLLLREYWKAYRPNDWLFPGANPSNPISERTAQAVFYDAVRKVGIDKKVSVH